MTDPETLTLAELRTLFLFERLSDEQLEWLAEHGQVETRQAGTPVITEGEDATCFYVLLDGTILLSRNVRGDRVELTRTDYRGSYFGATQAYIPPEKGRQTYAASVQAVTDVRVLQLPAEEFGAALREWFPMAMHLLEGLFLGLTASQRIVGQRERLLALGSLSAGLTHELNNPAAAAVRAAATLRQRVAGMRAKLAMLADGTLDASKLHQIVELHEAAVERVEKSNA